MRSVLNILSVRCLQEAQAKMSSRQKYQFTGLRKDLNLKYKFVSYQFSGDTIYLRTVRTVTR